MTLKELIADLTTAMEQATEGKWMDFDEHIFLVGLDGMGSDVIVYDVPRRQDAQSIATRHNTAGDVLRELTALDERRTHIGKAELVVDQISELFPEDTDLVPAIAQQTKDLDSVSGWWEFADDALSLLPGMDWDENDCESLVPNAKRCVWALVERATKAEAEVERLRRIVGIELPPASEASDDKVGDLMRRREEMRPRRKDSTP